MRLQEIEQQRLEDERVRLILEAQRAEERRRQQAAAEAAAQRQQQQAQQQQQLQPQAGTTLPTGGDDGAAPTPSPAPPNGDSNDGGGGGQTPRPNVPAPEPAPAPAPPAGGIVCPIAGSRACSDTWGAARSGGRSHEGVDLMSPGGTPIVAVVSGGVQFKQTNLGGNSVWLAGSNGTRYFYAHLSAFEGSSRSVSAGEVIGYVGATGNTSANHLHFEVHPGGDAAVNPYSYVRAAGC